MQSFFSNNAHDFTLYQGDAMDMNQLREQKFDMIFADPPYFLSRGYTSTFNGVKRNFDKGEWDRVRTMDEINTFNHRWLNLCRNYLKEDGTIWVSGTYHNIFSVATCMQELGYKILNIIVWQKSDPRPTLSTQYFSFTAEYLVWARKNEYVSHHFNCELMSQLNGGIRMPDVWNLPIISPWELRLGKHPTQKPLRLMYRIILSSTQTSDTIFDPFAGSCSTGIAANLLDRKFVGIDLNEDFLRIGVRRREQIEDAEKRQWMINEISQIPNEEFVMVNHARKELREKMIEQGICYLRAGDAKGSLLVKPGFERLHYVLLHTNGEERSLYRLKSKGQFQIWTKDTLEQSGFHPEHALYYIVLHFDNQHLIKLKKHPNLNERAKTFVAKLRPLSDFLGVK
jgi:site-specific DNA-methyltransferase (adenine-specific)